MTTHELARKLLDGPDMPVVVSHTEDYDSSPEGLIETLDYDKPYWDSNNKYQEIPKGVVHMRLV